MTCGISPVDIAMTPPGASTTNRVMTTSSVVETSTKSSVVVIWVKVGVAQVHEGMAHRRTGREGIVGIFGSGSVVVDSRNGV
jgi:hypothetical protein